ncbi:MAG: Hsp20/alpha crystallin family protein [Rhodopirellula sp.]|nr:Hsp20/alpha crystallin family protein [Rhodopirellula sp.]
MSPRTPSFSRIWNVSPATLDELRREFENAVGSVSGAVSRTCSSHPPVSVWESDQRLVIELDVPGVRQSDIQVSVEDGVLTIVGSRKPSQHAGEQKHADYRCGEFSRSVKLHESLDPTSIDAELDNGVLTLSIGRRAEAQPRSIPVAVRSRVTDPTPTLATENPE